jgi:hypothetical protein
VTLWTRASQHKYCAHEEDAKGFFDDDFVMRTVLRRGVLLSHCFNARSMTEIRQPRPKPEAATATARDQSGMKEARKEGKGSWHF